MVDVAKVPELVPEKGVPRRTKFGAPLKVPDVARAVRSDGDSDAVALTPLGVVADASIVTIATSTDDKTLSARIFENRCVVLPATN